MATGRVYAGLVALSLGASLGAGGFLTPCLAGDFAGIDFASADPAMNAAMAAARDTLPRFFAKASAADLSQGDYRVKWAHATEWGEAEREHVWVIIDRVDAQSVEGVLADQPVNFAGQSGDRVLVPQAEISDWMYYRADGLVEGCYTGRVMLAHLSEGEAAYLARQLAPLTGR